MMTEDLQKKLSLLDYSEDWVRTGILSESALESQLQEFATGEDPNKEHYRYRTIMAYLNSHNSFSDAQTEQIIKLLQIDADNAMASSVLISLLKRQSLTDEQFKLTSDALSKYGDKTEKYINKQRELRSGNNSSIK